MYFLLFQRNLWMVRDEANPLCLHCVWIVIFESILKLRNSKKNKTMPGSKCPTGLKTSKERKREKVVWPSLASAADPFMRQIYSGIQSRSLLWAWFSRKLISQAPSPVEAAWQSRGSAEPFQAAWTIRWGGFIKEPSCSSVFAMRYYLLLRFKNVDFV